MPQSDAFIAVNPPLPWVAHGAMGFVTGIGRDSLRLKYTKQGLVPLSSIEIALGDGEPLRLHGSIREGISDELFPDAESSGTLAELRGQLRKAQHIAICENQDVEASDRFTGLSEVHFMPRALPELSADQLDTSATFLSRKFALPFLITGMTGGIEQGAIINRRLARAAARFSIPMGVGSQRIALDQPALSPIFAVKREAPELFLIANLGAAQLLGADALDLCQRAVTMIEADALAIHLNVLQECIQVEGDRNFRGLLAAIARVSARLSVPVIIKEVGAGIDVFTARLLAEAGVAAVDVGGRGGTSWGYIEGLRSADRSTQDLALSFRDWGIPTAFALSALRQALPYLPAIATGGIRDGLSAAKAVALGAHLVGIGLPLLRAALVSEERTVEVLETMARGLRTTMMATGSRDLSQLSSQLCLGLPGAREFYTLLGGRHRQGPAIPSEDEQ